jgi:hypothetical protein
MNFFFALASIIILYPILLVLPFKLNAKQKFILIIISLLISLTGILSKELFPLWQTLLIMVALAGLASLLISKRMPENIVQETIDKANHAKIVNTFISNDLVHNESIIEDKELYTRVETKVDRVVSDEDTMEDSILEELALLAEVEPYVSDNFIEIMDEDNIINVPANLEPIFEEIHSNLYAAATIESDDEDLLKFMELEELDVSGEAIEINTPVSSHYLSEIEKLLQEEENENDSFIDEKEKQSQVEENKSEPVKMKEIKFEKLY